MYGHTTSGCANSTGLYGYVMAEVYSCNMHWCGLFWPMVWNRVSATVVVAIVYVYEDIWQCHSYQDGGCLCHGKV